MKRKTLERKQAGSDTGRTRRSGWSQLTRFSLFCALLGQSLVAQALGLGQASVQSYLNQPLDARIDLISRSEAEMATVTAALASPADFQIMGLTRTDIPASLEFTVNRDLADPHIRVTSDLPMGEPVVQIVVEVVWASGRMLRQYTLFLDPPTFTAPAPLPATSTRAPAAPQPAAPPPAVASETPATEAVREPATTDAGPPFDPAPAIEEPAVTMPPQEAPEASVEASPEALAADAPLNEPTLDDTPVDDEPSDPGLPDESVAETSPPDEPAVADPGDERAAAEELAGDSADAEPVIGEPAEPDTVAGASEGAEPVERTPEPVEESPPEPRVVQEPESEVPAFRAVLPEPGEGLPATVAVERGDTLWSLSQEYAQAQGTNVNQVMLAVQQKNPGAFIGGNINRLMAGAVLRMPTRDETRRLGTRAAMLEVMRQESLYRNRGTAPVSPDQVPTVTNLAEVAAPSGDGLAMDPQEPPAEPDLPEPEAPAETAPAVAEESRLELVPPLEDEAEEELALGQGGSGETGLSQGESVVEELARTQEELANAQQENEYLADRIAELEAELARREAPEGSGVADTTLAEMEDRLREERAAGAEEPELAVTPPDASGSWLERFGLWLLGLAIVLVGGVVMFLRRRQDLDSDDPLPSESPENPTSTGAPAPASPASAATPVMGPGKPAVSEEAEVADPDDPEARLDLARAYLAMGKTEQARELLEPVIENGTAAQADEARDMLGKR